MVDSFETVWLVIVSGGPRITENNIMDFSRKLASYSGVRAIIVSPERGFWLPVNSIPSI
jgi:hypothetical protein